MSNYVVTKDFLRDVQFPDETRTYKPITHEQLMDLTLNSIVGAGFTVETEKYTSAREGNVANGHYTLKNVADKEMQIQIGWQNSYDKTLSLKFAIGARVFICENGCVHGDMGQFKKKHMGEVQEFTPKTIMEYIKSAGDIFTQMQKEREAMKGVILDKRTKAELVGRMFLEEEFITSTQINIIKKEITIPTYDYNAPDSLWELYQFTTFGMKDIHPTLWMKNHMDAHKFFVNESGILVENTPKIVVPVDEYHISPNQLAITFENELE